MTHILLKILICGVSLLRDASKNYKNVISLCNPSNYNNFKNIINDIILATITHHQIQ
jgi:AICAR transformylase/IMP cyclohydrolase PurH